MDKTKGSDNHPRSAKRLLLQISDLKNRNCHLAIEKSSLENQLKKAERIYRTKIQEYETQIAEVEKKLNHRSAQYKRMVKKLTLEHETFLQEEKQRWSETSEKNLVALKQKFESHLNKVQIGFENKFKNVKEEAFYQFCEEFLQDRRDFKRKRDHLEAEMTPKSNAFDDPEMALIPSLQTSPPPRSFIAKFWSSLK